MKNYYRVMLGRGSKYAKDCFAGNFIGTDFDPLQDLTGQLLDDWRAFNRTFIPVVLKLYPGTTKVAAGLACGALWTVSKGINKGDMVLCPDGESHYHVGEVSGDYFYLPQGVLPHRRPVQWHDETINRADMSETLKKSTGASVTVCKITSYQDEIEQLLGGIAPPPPIPIEERVEDLAAFTLEKHLEDFLVQNWAQTDLGKEYDIYTVDGEHVGQQYPTDTGPLDILAISKDKQTLLVVELKRGCASDVVVGQILRYMGYVKEELAEPGQQVKGAIIALEDDLKIRRALSVSPNIAFYRYQVTFKLVKA